MTATSGWRFWIISMPCRPASSYPDDGNIAMIAQSNRQGFRYNEMIIDYQDFDHVHVPN